MDRGLNELLRWGIENSAAPQSNGANGTNGANGAGATTTGPTGPPNAEVLAALFGGPSEADLMREAMAAALVTDAAVVPLDDRLVALDNLEQLVESLDNANNLVNLGLWEPLLRLLRDEERAVRKMAAWCVGTAVQNNEPAQRALFARGGVPALVAMALGERLPLDAPAPVEGGAQPVAAGGDDDEDKEHSEVRRKAAYALGSAVRNYQDAMDAASEELGRRGVSAALGGGGKGSIDATDMEAVDAIITRLKEEAMQA